MVTFRHPVWTLYMYRMYGIWIWMNRNYFLSTFHFRLQHVISTTQPKFHFNFFFPLTRSVLCVECIFLCFWCEANPGHIAYRTTMEQEQSKHIPEIAMGQEQGRMGIWDHQHVCRSVDSQHVFFSWFSIKIIADYYYTWPHTITGVDELVRTPKQWLFQPTRRYIVLRFSNRWLHFDIQPAIEL